MRLSTLFNSGWKFQRGEIADAETTECDDSDWRQITVPHDWSIEEPFDQRWASATAYLPGGIGWYRKRFSHPSADDLSRVYVDFDGAYCNSEVWINGHYLGKRPNGFSTFRYDLTPYLLAGDNNVLAVRVDHSQFADCRWYTGSGLYRNVHLIVTNAVHIKQWGVFATTPVINEREAQVDVAVTLQNHSTAAANVQVESSLLDADGSIVAQATTSAAVAPTQEHTSAVQLWVPQPKLWSVDQPTLYVLRTRVYRDGQLVDSEDTRIGIRSIRFDAAHGFFLNEQNIKLKGVCLHDDAGALGTAVPPKVWERRLRTLKEAGTNAIRMAHNPHMPELYDLCDEIGFLVQDEAFDEWELGKNKWIEGWNVGTPGKDGYSEDFAAWNEADLRDMILRDRNHPSVIMWSIGNEIDYPNDPYTHEILDQGTNPQMYGRGFQPTLPHADRLGTVAQQLADIVRSYDTTRPITAALAAALVSNETSFPDALDIVGYNYQEYRYHDDHAQYPDRILYGSENKMHGNLWQAVADNAFIAGQFLWTGIDYLGEARQWPSRSNTAGLLDLAGSPKSEFYFRQSLWTATPMVYIATRDVPAHNDPDPWTPRGLAQVWHGASGDLIRVICFTNCEQAELLLNGESLGVKDRQSAEDHMLFWDVPFQPGTLTAKGLHNGTAVATWELSTSGPAHSILAESDASTLQADGIDLAHITVTLVDEHGVPVWSDDHEVTWSIEGPARLLGLESGDPASHERYQSLSRRTFHGRMMGYVQAVEDSGHVWIRLSAPGLQDAQVTLQSAPSSK